jgi:glycosyltransferase involved in cell wall biosynthesis
MTSGLGGSPHGFRSAEVDDGSVDSLILARMRIIVCHNYYRHRGGEDGVFEVEANLLVSRGHEVHKFVRRNDEFSGLETIAVAGGTIWNRSAAGAVADLVRDEGADVVHFHNWLPQISQGAFHAARGAGAAVVQTLHNYRFTCAKGVLFRDGAICEECVGRTIGWPALVHGCYRDSRVATVPVVGALATHRILNTSERAVDATIVLSEFARSKLIESGLPPQRVYVKPNFVAPDPGEQSGSGGYVTYVGRMSEEKGIATLLDAWALADDLPVLKIAGSGPLVDQVETAAADNPRIEYLGLVGPDEIPDILGDAAFSIMPSVNYEGFPRAIVESFAVGTPVIASRIGSLTELIDAGRTGLLFEPGKPDSLVEAVRNAVAEPSSADMRAAARHEYLNRYGIDRNYDVLMDIYQHAIDARHATD